MIMKSEWERIEMNGNVIGCDIGVGFDTISAIQHWKENKQMNEWMSNPTNIDLNWVHTVIMYILYHKNEWWIVDKEISLNLYKVDQSCELQWDIWMIIRSNQWMNEWMISYLRIDWQTQYTTHNQWSVNQ